MGYTREYKEIKRANTKSVRSIVRNFALSGLSMFNSDKALEQPRVHFLYIHHVFDDELKNFELLLTRLSKNHQFISYSEAVDRILSARIDQAYIAISSDDGFKNNLKAAEVLNKFNAKACFFINPNSIGLSNIKAVKTFCRKQLNFPPTEFMNWKDVESLIRSGHEIGSHTMGHVNVANIPLSKFKEDLEISAEVIKKHCGEIKHFAYPYGRYFHFNQETFELVFKAGYESCASAERGSHFTTEPIKMEKLFIRRDHVICDWKMNHIFYFLQKSAKSINATGNLSPYV